MPMSTRLTPGEGDVRHADTMVSMSAMRTPGDRDVHQTDAR